MLIINLETYVKVEKACLIGARGVVGMIIEESKKYLKTEKEQKEHKMEREKVARDL